MPSFITHQIISEDVYHSLSEKTKNRIDNLSAYYLGAQGPDPFFVYMPFNLKPYNLGKLLHRENVYGFFNSAKEYAEKKNAAISYPLGFITHYATDVIFHPYVYALESEIKKELPHLRKKDKVHFLIEKDLDAFLFEEKRKGKARSYYYPVSAGDNTCNEIYNFLDDTVWNNFSVRLNREGVYNSLKRFVKHNRLSKDKYGIKYHTVNFIESVLFLPKYLSSFFIRPHPDVRILNYKKEITPFSPDGLSVFELYDKAVNLSVKLIKEFLSGKELSSLFSTDMNIGKKKKR